MLSNLLDLDILHLAYKPGQTFDAIVFAKEIAALERAAMLHALKEADRMLTGFNGEYNDKGMEIVMLIRNTIAKAEACDASS